MSVSDPSTPGRRPADCHANCPYYEPVSGSCGHDLRQVIATAFREHPGIDCPIYRRGRPSASGDPEAVHDR